MQELLEGHKACKIIHKSQNEDSEDMLSKANAKIEFFAAVHSEGLVFSVTERPFVFRTILKHFISFLSPLPFRHRSRKNSLIKLWHHDSKIPFRGCDQILFPVKKSVFNGIRDTVVKFTDCVDWFETMNESVNTRIAG